MADTDTPNPTTAIPQLAAMDLTDEEFQAVVACENAVTSLLVGLLKPKGASLRCRIELAAAILLQGIDHAHDAATETGMMEPDALMKTVIDLVELRALEIWGQGRSVIAVLEKRLGPPR